MHFVAQLVNPKPLGDIASSGNFGPWNADEPSDTPVNGSYSFTHADLSTTHGIAGMLSSQGKYSGQLDTITVDGTTDTPDFSVDVSGHKVDLTTQFHAIVNGTNGTPICSRSRRISCIPTLLLREMWCGRRGQTGTIFIST